ncbi:MAG: phosphate regulon transcriptional regulator PhoB [Gammaproteobacteria bacterium]|nr:phosphate regulon transcriptional regulator PhoB [Gammaproteobacteria bacterium]
MNTIKILVVDDEAPIRMMLRQALVRHGFEVEEAGDGSEALNMVADSMPDLMLLDWMMPNLSGIELVQKLRRDEVTKDLPIIMLTAKVEEGDRVKGLDLGVDDYVTKPFSPRELIARINAVLRRSNPAEADGIIEHGLLKLDASSHRVTIDSQLLELGPTEFKLLRFFMNNSDKVFSRNQLLDRVWSRGSFIEERTVDVHIRRLRKALEPFLVDGYLQTVRGSGYRFSANTK